MTDLCRKYRPKCLDDVLGQPGVVDQLRVFLRDPHPAAFLFHGESGVGKTATAYALASELGCVVDEDEMGGLREIPSGEMNGDGVRAATKYLHYYPLMGSGWKVLIANEADRMSPQAETLWLDFLERIPAKPSR